MMSVSISFLRLIHFELPNASGILDRSRIPNHVWLLASQSMIRNDAITSLDLKTKTQMGPGYYVSALLHFKKVPTRDFLLRDTV